MNLCSIVSGPALVKPHVHVSLIVNTTLHESLSATNSSANKPGENGILETDVLVGKHGAEVVGGGDDLGSQVEGVRDLKRGVHGQAFGDVSPGAIEDEVCEVCG